MPWKETCPMNEKMKFIVAWQSQEFGLSELCRSFNISRKTGYKLIERYKQAGVVGLEPQSRAHHSHARETDKKIVKLLLDLKHRYPHWGPRKIRDWLEIEHPKRQWPASSTIGEIYKKHGLVKPRKVRRKTPPHSEPFLSCEAPNHVWSIDFKGQFRLGTGKWCYPLTATDNFSRFLLGCQGLYRPEGESVKTCLERLFREYGLPDAIRTDNGTPFASTSIGGLSRLSIWWIKLGIMPERIDLGCPQQNGRHERMHRTLKAETAKPPKSTLGKQQHAFDSFRQEYNFERPHESLDKKRPGQLYKSSRKRYPGKLPGIEYDDNVEVRVVRPKGEIRWKGHDLHITALLSGEPVALEEVSEGQWQLYYSALKLGIVDARSGRIKRPA